jgi:methionyl-tRNA synthetase
MKILVTSALPYVNNEPHLGNIIGCVLSADVYARFCRQRGDEVLYICGTDEYGSTTEVKARESGITCQELCDKYHKIHKDIYDHFNISFDYFGRTTTNKQTEIAQQIFIDLANNDNLIEKTVQQLYCEEINSFVADRYVKGICPKCMYVDANGDQCDNCSELLNAIELINPYYKLNKNYKLIIKSTDHLFLDLPKLQPKIKEWFNESSESWSETAKGITRGFCNKDLQERCITRDLKWGTPVPNTEKYGDKYKNKVFYVWFDAPIGYLSITANHINDWESWWKNPDVNLVQFMAKDNVPFHSIIFPGSLIGTGKDWNLVNNIAAVEYLNCVKDGKVVKFSKSNNVGIFGTDVIESNIDVDLWRFYLILNRPEKSDSQFIIDDFKRLVNTEIIANIGNLVNRVLSLTHKNFGIIPEIDIGIGYDEEYILKLKNIIDEYNSHLTNVRLKQGLTSILNIGHLANQYINNCEPWNTIKTNRLKCGNDLHVLSHTVGLISELLYPFLPNTSTKIRNMLNIDNFDTTNLTGQIKSVINKPEVLFKKIE